MWSPDLTAAATLELIARNRAAILTRYPDAEPAATPAALNQDATI